LIVDDLCAIADEALRARHMDVHARLCLFAMARAAAEDFSTGSRPGAPS
jgi:hypothetical protein